MEGLQTIPRENALAFIVTDLEASLGAVDGRNQSLMSMNFVFNALHTSSKHAITDHLVRTSAKVALIAKCFGRDMVSYESVDCLLVRVVLRNSQSNLCAQ